MPLGKLTKKTYLGSRRLKRILVFFRLYNVLPSQQLTAEIFYFKSMEVI
jgi:hypothetical protein